ncbi:5-methyltetrahydropteroyltriglutamate-homocysteine methyltransferase [Lophium mytilinum]|uniref:5-methyltetrahydropteroyltriglutamate-homocysteine methyltransferase n=1 Tax=Lophium mytilinum TaxID=390894 RepID=A0A6A6RE26_9PEZI|nr:5-methyltetrahydropteroyltriglutamate-homocysteine methyltransferase [Lophium mytilinum]
MAQLLPQYQRMLHLSHCTMSSHIHRNPPFRAEHLGSLKRPQYLLENRFAVDKNEAISEHLTPLEDQAIKEIVETQVKLGFRAISDGEYRVGIFMEILFLWQRLQAVLSRRHMFWGTLFPGLDGFEEIKNPGIEMFRLYVPDIAAFTESGHKPGETVICTGKIKHTGESTYLEQVEYLKTLLPKERWGEIKLTLAAPNWYHLRYAEGKAYPKDVYRKDAEYFNDIAAAYQAELDILHKAGLRNKHDQANSTTIEELFDAYINFYNDCIPKAPAEMHIGIHLCRGNFVISRHFSEGGYDRIATKLFRDLNVSTYYLEYDTPRAGGFEPLRSLPKNKNVILGVITSKFPEMEDIEEMKKRIYQAAEMVAKGSGQTKEDALKRLGVSPQCGFASHAEGNLIDIEGMKKKLALLRQIADEIWPGEP